MALAARFSDVFYERFGLDAVDELIAVLNQMDLNAQASLRELNDVNFSRFDAKLEQRIAELRADMRSGMAQLRVEIHRGIGELRSAVADQFVTHMRRTIGMWVAALLAIIGLRSRR